LATTGGNIILLSTPHGKQGYFYDAFQSENFSKFHISTEQVAEQRPEPQRTRMLEHLAHEKKVKSTLIYTQEYLGEFLDELRQVFSDELIKKVCILKRRENKRVDRDYYLGVDVGAMGDDPSVFAILDRTNRDAVEQVESIITRKKYTTETAEKVTELDKIYEKIKKIGIDDGGVGFGVFSELQREPRMRDKTIGLNNARRVIETTYKDGKKVERKKGIFKEEMYENLKAMMERGRIKLLDDDEITLSLKSAQYEIDDEKKKIKIINTFNHPVEAINRAAWLCEQDKSLKLWAA